MVELNSKFTQVGAKSKQRGCLSSTQFRLDFKA